MDESKLRENIKRSREILNISAAQLAEKIGAKSQQTIYDIESGKVGIKYGVLVKIKKALPNLETGLEASFGTVNTDILSVKVDEKSIVSPTSLNIKNKDISVKDSIEIPEYDVLLSAGQGTYPDDHALIVGSRPFDPNWLTKKGLNRENLSLMRVHGDSMDPLLKDKDIIMIDSSKTSPNDGSPFAVRVENTLYIKLVNKKNETLTLTSINKAYDPILINTREDDCQIIGAVVWHAHSWV